MFCVKCGFQIKDGYRFCPKCGAPAYIEREEPRSEVNEEVDEVAMTSKVESKSRKKETDFVIHDDLIPNPLITKELDFEGVEKKAHKGSIDAKLRLAFRYEKGIGCEIEHSKAKELLSSIDDNIIPWDYTFGFKDEICQPLCIKKDEAVECTDVDVEEDNDMQNNWGYPKTISYFKDLLLDFALKSAYVHIYGRNIEKESENLKKDFASNLIELRDEYPELLFVNYPQYVNKDAISNLFLKIKDNAARRYVPFFFLPQYSVHYIGNNRIEYPTICEFGKSLDIHYDSRNNKIRTINLLLLHLLLSVPIKKVRITFVDLGEKFDEEFLIKNLNPILYNNPINREEDFHSFLNLQNERRLSIKKKYGNYPDYCNRNKCIPVPYEVVVFLDEYIDDEKWDKINYYVTEGYSVGVCCVFCNKTGSMAENKSFVDMISNKTPFFYNSLTSSFYGDKNVIPWRDGGITEQSGAFLYYGKQQRENEEHPFDNDLQLLDVPMEGDFEVVLRKNRYSSADIVSKVFNLLEIPNIYINDSTIILASLSSKEDGYNFIKDKYNKYADLRNLAPFGEHNTGVWFDIQYVKHGRTYIVQSVKSNQEALVKYTPVVDNEVMLRACLYYINSEAETKEEMKVQTLDFASATENTYEPDLSTMTIPVGKAEANEVNFRMDLVSHVHSFIIGQSGSGKSVFLHNIIGGAMLKYAPEDLQLYLLDFKLGGVEFNRYQGAKHVKALLVDNSDPQVTLEILRELRNSMTERGKLLRSAGVNNIGEYNKMHQQDRMPHVLVVADECHEMFKADDSIPRQVRNEISDIVIKIAKEGRSQGVHLVFATQTLSGTEISSEIINNVSDFYLLKCAQTDSERLVPNSSAITSELSTGQIYYHHVDEQVKFQAYYTDKEAAEKLMAAIVEKAKDHRSNGEFYFNGAQMFYLDESVKEQMLTVKGKSPVAFMGKAIDISQKDLYIKLNEDFSENVLLLGLNDQEQVTRTTMNLFVSLMMSAKLKHKDIAFKVIDCLNNEEGEVHELIFDLENEGYCEIIERRQRSKFFKELAQSVLDGTAEETILLILGQDRFRELKMDMELEESNNSKSSDDDDMMSISDDFFGDSSSSSTSVRTYRDAMNVILEKGPDYGVHTLLQIEKASNLLFEDYITPKVLFQKFKHLVMLKSDETAGVTLHLNDDIRLEKLSSDWERLRAYYYAEESDSYTLFTPYMPSKSKDIINLLKMI